MQGSKLHFENNAWWQDLRQVTKQQIHAEKMKNPHEYDATQEQKSTGIKKKWNDK